MIIYEGTATKEILDAMLARFDNKRHTFLVVPDRFSLEAEEAMLAAQPSGASVKTEVTTLARLVERLSDPHRRRLSAEGAVMAIASVMQNLEEKLICLGGYTGAAEEIYATIEQLIASDVTPEDLVGARVGGDAALERKLNDLALIYGAYRDFLAQGYCDAADDVAAAVRAVGAAEFVRDADFFLVGYDDLTRSNLRLVREFDVYAHSVTVGAEVCDYAFGGGSLLHKLKKEPKGIFVRVPDTLSPLKRYIADTADDERVFPESYRDLAKPDESLSVYRAETKEEGLERIARDAVWFARAGGRYGDIAVLTEDPVEAAETLEEYGVPVNVDRSYPVGQDPLARCLSACLRLAVTHYKTAAVRSLVYNPLLGISEADGAVWDNYTVRCGISYARHMAPYEIGEDGPERDTAEKVRKRVIGEIKASVEGLTGAQTVGAFVGACKEILAKFSPKMSAVRLRYPPDAADFSAQAERKLGDILDNLGYSCSAKATPEFFAKILESGVSASVIRVTPTYADAVNVFTADSFGFRVYKRLYWMGADEGRLPTAKSDCGLISDVDIDRLAVVGAAIDPKIDEVNARARTRVFSTVFCADALVAVVTGGRPNFFAKLLESRYLADTVRADEDAETEEETLTESSRRAVLRASVCASAANRTAKRSIERARARGKDRLSPAVSALAFATGNASDPPPPEKLRHAHELFFGSERTSVSQIENFFTCPYRHFLQYGLRCAERRVARVQANDVGVFLHAVAERFSARCAATPEECDAAANEIADGLIEESPLFRLETDQTAIVRAAIKKESRLLCRRLFAYAKHTDFSTERVEANFGQDLPAVRAGGIQLHGYIDRIDGDGDGDVVVLDYKTGKTDYTLSDVYYGRQIQLFAYMTALKSMGRRPAGALFFPITADYGRTSVACSGWVSGDPATVAKLDRDLTINRPDSEILPVGLNKIKAKSGEWALRGGEHAFTEDDWDRWLGYTAELIAGAVEDLDDGRTDNRPLFSAGSKALPCAYCAGRSACVSTPCARIHRDAIKKDDLVLPESAKNSSATDKTAAEPDLNHSGGTVGEETRNGTV